MSCKGQLLELQQVFSQFCKCNINILSDRVSAKSRRENICKPVIGTRTEEKIVAKVWNDSHFACSQEFMHKAK
jgi:hypothetical protein